ncbi:hypothetical protein JG550_000854 [Curtobacterium flaccumfaciens pv. flaccumfaciens]|uniref:hypothetical protein n=1 Tax=Curtobacterium flaccumfaciens TaxID=2035 RepID=UPI001ADB6E68|nr:hypothetical protein [Curtobacterium flaccumfaciens]MBO9046721.1 hypothetical protein [Curtobacterium flaccumfaciens pv. flaccumfaciens]QTR91595.1 hypothetical protein JG550_000854 [Curtobacterium flaccumfaciens pv. flaccumfaciens]
MPEHKWAPPEHPDVTLHQPVTLDANDAGQLRTLDPVAPVWADIDFVGVGVLHLKCFAAAQSDTAVLVRTAWQGRLQQVLVSRDRVTRRALDAPTR